MISKEEAGGLWDALLKKHNYSSVLNIIKTNPDELLNAIHPSEDFKLSLFSKVITYAKKEKSPEELIKYIVTHEKFQLHNKNCDETNIDSIISVAQLDVTKLLKNDPRLVFNGEKLTYECIKKNLEEAKKNYNKHLDKDPNSNLTKNSKSRLERLDAMLELVEEATIRLAIKQDNVDLLKKLEESGGIIDDFSVDNKLVFTTDLLTKDNVKLNKFFKEKSELLENIWQEEDKKEEQRIKLINEQIKTLTEEHHKAQTKLIEEHIQKRTERIDEMLQIIEKTENKKPKSKTSFNIFNLFRSPSEDDDVPNSKSESKNTEETNKKKPGLFNKNSKENIKNTNNSNIKNNNSLVKIF